MSTQLHACTCTTRTKLGTTREAGTSNKLVSSGNQCTYIDTMTSIKSHAVGIIFLANITTMETNYRRSYESDRMLLPLRCTADSDYIDKLR